MDVSSKDRNSSVCAFVIRPSLQFRNYLSSSSRSNANTAYLSPHFSLRLSPRFGRIFGNNFASQTPAMQDVNQRISALLALIAPGKITQESGNHFITRARQFQLLNYFSTRLHHPSLSFLRYGSYLFFLLLQSHVNTTRLYPCTSPDARLERGISYLGQKHKYRVCIYIYRERVDRSGIHG